jgi:hypothetical protein
MVLFPVRLWDIRRKDLAADFATGKRPHNQFPSFPVATEAEAGYPDPKQLMAPQKRLV